MALNFPVGSVPTVSPRPRSRRRAMLPPTPGLTHRGLLRVDAVGIERGHGIASHDPCAREAYLCHEEKGCAREGGDGRLQSHQIPPELFYWDYLRPQDSTLGLVTPGRGGMSL